MRPQGNGRRLSPGQREGGCYQRGNPTPTQESETRIKNRMPKKVDNLIQPLETEEVQKAKKTTLKGGIRRGGSGREGPLDFSSAVGWPAVFTRIPLRTMSPRSSPRVGSWGVGRHLIKRQEAGLDLYQPPPQKKVLGLSKVWISTSLPRAPTPKNSQGGWMGKVTWRILHRALLNVGVQLGRVETISLLQSSLSRGRKEPRFSNKSEGISGGKKRGILFGYIRK